MKIVFATNNSHKLDEVRQILDAATAEGGGEAFEVLSLADIGCHEDIPETADTLEGNAMQKVQYVKERYGYDCFADDTGLEVAALGGAPGIYSARYASLFSDDDASHDSEANMRCLLHNLEGKSDRAAQFRTAIALIYKGESHLFEGTVRGEITTTRHGTEGFGYDPIFRPLPAEKAALPSCADGDTRTFAEMSSDEKNAISHRGRATQELAAFLSGRATSPSLPEGRA